MRILRPARLLPPLLATLALAGVVALAAGPWLRQHMVWRDVADAHAHLIRIYAVDAALRQGDWYPRWLADLYLGYGYPLLNFYAPATYYAGTLLHRLGATVYGSLQLLGALATAAGAAGAYRLVLAVAERPANPPARAPHPAGVLAAAVYALSPYPFLTNLYIRAALPEALALGLLPWLLLAAWRAWQRGGWWTVVLAAGVAVMVLTHNLSALFALALVVPWLAGAAVLLGRPSPWGGRQPGTPTQRLRDPVLGAAARVAAAIGVGLCLAAFFWLPAVAESRHVQLDLLRGGIYDYRTWLFDPVAADERVARADYPHTRHGPADLHPVYDYSALDKAVPAKPSLGQVLMLGFAVTAGAAARRRFRSPTGGLALFCAALAVAGGLMVTTWSAPLWQAVPLVGLIQFPWRLYGPVSLLIALAAGAALAAWSAPSRGAPAAHAAAAVLATFFALNALLQRPLLPGQDPPHDVDSRTLASEEYNRFGAGTTSGGEFLPRSVYWADYAPGVRRGIRVYEEAYPQAGWQAGLVRVLEGRAAVTGIFQTPNWILAETEAETPSRMAFHQLHFPGWRAFVDGREVAVTPAPYHERLAASLGFMVVDVPPGSHRVEVRFGATPPRVVGVAVSALAAGVVLVAAGYLAAPAAARRRPRAALAAALVLPLLAAGCAAAGAEAAGRARSRVPAAAARVVVDVAEAVRRTEAETRGPGGSGRGELPPFLEAGYMAVNQDTRRWLYMHPPAQASVRLTVPAGAYFQAALAVDPEVWQAPVGDGVRFVLEAEGPAGKRVLLDRTVNPRARSEDRGWNDVWLDLAGLAGQEVLLTLRTEAGQDLSFDWAGWGHPQVVLWRAARPFPGAVHPW